MKEMASKINTDSEIQNKDNTRIGYDYFTGGLIPKKMNWPEWEKKE